MKFFREKPHKVIFWSGFVLVVVLTVGVIALASYFSWGGRTVASINGQKITRNDVLKEQERLKKQYKGTESEKTDYDLYCEAENRLIEEKTILTESAKRGLSVTDAESENNFQEKIKRFQEGNEETALKTLKKIYSWSKEEYLKITKKDLLREKLQKNVLKEYDLSYVMVRNDRIVTATNQPDVAGNKLAAEKIQEVQKRLVGGESFESLKKELQSDPKWEHPLSTFGTLKNVNEVKAKKITQGNAEWNAVQKLNKVGDFTDIVESEGGYYIIYRADTVSSGDFRSWDEYQANVLKKNGGSECSTNNPVWDGVKRIFAPQVKAACNASNPLTTSASHKAMTFIDVLDFWDYHGINNQTVGVQFHDCRGWSCVSATHCGTTKYSRSGTTGTAGPGSWASPENGLYCAYDYWINFYPSNGYAFNSVILQDALFDGVELYIGTNAKYGAFNRSNLTQNPGGLYSVISKPINGAGFTAAQFIVYRTYNLTVSVSPAVAATPTGAGRYAVDSFAQAGFTNVASGYTFTGWSGSCTGTVNPKTVLMDGDKSCTANFIADPPPPEGNCSCRITPQTGLSPLVVQVNVANNGLPATSIWNYAFGTTVLSGGTPYYYTFPVSGTYNVSVRHPNGTTCACNPATIEVRNPTNGGGNEVAP